MSVNPNLTGGSGKKVVSEFSYVDPSKVGKKIVVEEIPKEPPPTYIETVGVVASTTTRRRGTEPQAAASSGNEKVSGGRHNTVLLQGFLVFTVMCIVLYLLATGTGGTEATGKVTGMTWKHTVYYKEGSWVQKEDSVLPPGAVVVSAEDVARVRMVVVGKVQDCVTKTKVTKEHRYVRTDVKCLDNGECKENDVFEQVEVPSSFVECTEKDDVRPQTYVETWYVYRVQEWISSSVSTGGSLLYDVTWPKIPSNTALHEYVQTGTEATYTISIYGDHQYVTSNFDEYASFGLGDVIHYKLSVFGSVTAIWRDHPQHSTR